MSIEMYECVRVSHSLSRSFSWWGGKAQGVLGPVTEPVEGIL